MLPAARSPDVIVVGAGVIGLSTALALLDAGRTVQVHERNAVGPGGASWAGGGILAPLEPGELDPRLLPLVREALRLQPGWCASIREASGVDPEFTASGLSVLAPADPESWRHWAAGCGQPIVDDGEGLLLPEIAQVRSPRLLRGLAAAVRNKGGTIGEGSNVRGFDGGSHVAGVVTDDGVHPCGAAVLCAGAWSEALDPSARVEPMRGQMLLFRAPGMVDRMLLRDHMYVIPRRDGFVAAGSTLEAVGFDDSTTAAGREAILEAVRGLCPALADAPVVAHWAGLRPAPAGPLPFVGAAPGRAGLFHNCGHYRLGITLAPASAQRIAQILA